MFIKVIICVVVVVKYKQKAYNCQAEVEVTPFLFWVYAKSKNGEYEPESLIFFHFGPTS